jgi:DNA primase
MLWWEEQPLPNRHMDITSQWFNYLHTQRKLTQEVIRMSGLDVYQGRLKIPVYDENGNYKFSKFRKAPWEENDEPKYKYEFGSSVSLYGIDHIGDDMIICEGELDALALLSCGFNACTSTGGAMTFRQEWVELFDGKNVTIMFDNDDAGIRGAVKTAFLFKKFTYRWVPPRYGKDVSDVLINYDQEMLKVLMRNDENKLDIEIPDFSTKKEMREYRRELVAQARQMTAGSIGTHFIRAIIVELSVRLAERKKRAYTAPVDGGDKERANAYPIENIIEVARDGTALCPFHNEKTGSLHVYKDNHAFCFGCQKRADAIAIAMAVWNVDFKEAIKRLNQ